MLRRRVPAASVEIEIVDSPPIPPARSVTVWEHAAARLDRDGLERVAAETGRSVEDLIVDAVNGLVADEITRLDDRVKAGISDTMADVVKGWHGA